MLDSIWSWNLGLKIRRAKLVRAFCVCQKNPWPHLTRRFRSNIGFSASAIASPAASTFKLKKRMKKFLIREAFSKGTTPPTRLESPMIQAQPSVSKELLLTYFLHFHYFFKTLILKSLTATKPTTTSKSTSWFLLRSQLTSGMWFLDTAANWLWKITGKLSLTVFFSSQNNW